MHVHVHVSCRCVHVYCMYVSVRNIHDEYELISCVQVKACNNFVGPRSPFIINLPYDDPQPSRSWQFSKKKKKNTLVAKQRPTIYSVSIYSISIDSHTLIW